MGQAAALLGLLIAVPMVFVVALTQVNGLQDTTKGLVPSTLEPLYGTITVAVLIIAVVVVFGLIWASLSFIFR